MYDYKYLVIYWDYELDMEERIRCVDYSIPAKEYGCPWRELHLIEPNSEECEYPHATGDVVVKVLETGLTIKL